jgi:hypothetical protein
MKGGIEMIPEEGLKELETFFYETTGLSPGYTQEEWNKYYLASLEKLASREEGAYEREILDMMKMIIEDKDYTTLHSILCNYDTLMKKHLGKEYLDLELPYWSYAATAG